MDPVVIAAVIAAAASIWVAYINTKDRGKANEVHRALTVNHHSSQNPTVLDLLSDIKAELVAHREDPHAHKKKKDRS